MPVEIERRFLVSDLQAVLATGDVTVWRRLKQGYFGKVKGLRVRVRIVSDAGNCERALISLKGPKRGLCRTEYEFPMPIERARRELLSLPPSRIIHKVRYDVSHGGVVWSVDRFQGANAGLVLAEVEPSDPDQRIELPPWVAQEVTHDRRYGNSRLARSPLASAARGA